MNYERWFKENREALLYKPLMLKGVLRESWQASQSNTRQAVLEYMDFLEDEYPENERWENLKVFVKGKE